MVYPDGSKAGPGAEGERLADDTARIRWDWQGPRAISRPGHARVWVRFTKRKAPGDTEGAKEAGR